MNSWISPLSIVALEKTSVTFNAPSNFIKQWVINNYFDDIESAVKEELEGVIAIDFVTGKQSLNESTEVADKTPQKKTENNSEIGRAHV